MVSHAADRLLSTGQPVLRDPCGPDLDSQGDEDYLNFVKIAEGLLPAEYFKDGVPFNPAEIDVDGQIARLAPLLKRTRDVRLLVLLTRFLVLDRDLAGFTAAAEAISRLLETYWDKVHPCAEGGSYVMRAVAIAALNEPPVFIPLQYMPLCEDRRFGIISLRANMYATGNAKPYEGEGVQALPLRECDSAYFEVTRDLIARLAGSLTRLHALFTEHCGFGKAPHLDKITATVAGMAALMDEASGREGQTEGPAARGMGQTGALGLIKSAFGAGNALEAAIEYFRCREPSSPVLPLIAQARELQGKTFVEVMQMLLPDHTKDAAYTVGDQKMFALPLERLASVMPAIENYGLEEHTADLPPARFPPSADLLAEPSGCGEKDSAVAPPESAAEEGYRADEGAEIAPTNGAGEVLETDASVSVTTAASRRRLVTVQVPRPARKGRSFALLRSQGVGLDGRTVLRLRVADPLCRFAQAPCGRQKRLMRYAIAARRTWSLALAKPIHRMHRK